MKTPEEIRRRLESIFQKRHPEWLRSRMKTLDEGISGWPLELSLGSPTCKSHEEFEAISQWIRSWQDWPGEGNLQWRERTFRGFGTHSMPVQLIFTDASQVARVLGQTVRWEKAFERFEDWLSRWPQLGQALSRYFAILADYPDVEFQRLTAVLDWMVSNPQSGLYLRQLPIPGVHTKWIETRKSVVMKLVALIKNISFEGASFYKVCGLRRMPRLVRMRVLDPKLREHVGGLVDITAPAEELVSLTWEVPRVLIVENLQTGLAFEDMPGTVVLMKLGNRVNVLGHLPWLAKSSAIYWGDIDTYGLAILDHARKYIPQMKSTLMDEETLLAHQDLWVMEEQQHGDTPLVRLSLAERELYQSLKQNVWGSNIRLEQERIPWSTVVLRIEKELTALDSA